jgi:hypothetical protein
MISRHALWALVVGAGLAGSGALSGCNCGEEPGVTAPDAGGDAGPGEDGGGDPGDGGGDGGGNTGSDGGACLLEANGQTCAADGECCSGACSNAGICVSGAGACLPLGELCQANVECCAGRTCAEDGTGQKRCADESFCRSAAETCTQASECCSLSCSGTCQGAGGLCAPAADPCTDNVNCCSNKCQGGVCQTLASGCSSLGERCSAAGYSEGCCSKYCVDYGVGGASDLRCARASSCNARGDICTTGSDCCSGACLNGVCPTQAQLGQKLFVGEPCSADAQCASYACASTTPGGPKTCQFLGGCRPAEEICTEDWQCCGFLELSANRNMCKTAQPTPGACGAVAGVPGLRRCVLQPTDKEVGEICLSGGQKVHQCCGGDEVCQPTITGVSRCMGGSFSADGGCVGNGGECSIADQCCGKICAPGTYPDGGPGYFCSACVAEGSACSTHNDCCGKICTNGVCAPAPDSGTCTPLGGACTTGSECCSEQCANGSCSTIIG